MSKRHADCARPHLDFRKGAKPSMSKRHLDYASAYLVGPPVLTLEGFYGREKQVEDFFRRLNTPQMHCQRVLGTRRSGKTSFLCYVSNPEIYRARIHTEGLPVILAYVDLEATIDTPLLFFGAVASAIANATPEGKKISVPNRFADIHSFDVWLKKVRSLFRVVVLLDEFEVLAQSEKFDIHFFRKLRALARDKIVWATASYRDVATLSKPAGTKDLASPLYNIFHSEPIYLGPLGDTEAESLVRNPAASHGIIFSNDEVEAIRVLAGDMPYLLQTAAEKLFLARSSGVGLHDYYATIRDELLVPGNLVGEQFSSLWSSLSFRCQRILKLLAGNKPVPKTLENNAALGVIERFGVVWLRNGVLKPGGLLQEWVLKYSGTSPGTPHIFIGHGHSKLWLQVKNYIRDELNLIPVCYESRSRIGESIVPILTEMIEKADFAIIVVTGEDKTADNSLRPRQNVVHEMGLFQGHLGFDRTVVLMEEGVDFLSNLDGMQVIRFQGNDIEMALSKLSRVLRREQILL